MNLLNSESLIIYYHSDDLLGRQVVAYANAYVDDIRTVDLAEYKLTGIDLKQISMHLERPIREIINIDMESFERLGIPIPERNDEVIELILHDPALLRGPVIVSHQETFVPKSTGELLCWLDQNTLQAI